MQVYLVEQGDLTGQRRKLKSRIRTCVHAWQFVPTRLFSKFAVCCFLQGWIVASDSVTDTTYVVRNLRPDTTYIFLVRAQNSHGLSLPSPVTAAIKTKGIYAYCRLHSLHELTIFFKCC